MSDQHLHSPHPASLMTALSLALHTELKYNRRAEVASPRIGMAREEQLGRRGENGRGEIGGVREKRLATG